MGDKKISQLIRDTTSETGDALSSSFTPIAGGTIGYRMAALGDSGTEGFATGIRSDNWVTILAATSQGRIHLVKNAGKGGDTSAMMLARIEADILPFKPHFCTVQAGGNDWSLSVDFEITKSNLKAIVAKLRSNNIVPVLSTIVPRPSANDSTIAVRNTWIRRYAEQERLLLLDFNSILADPVTGGWKSGQSLDNIHAQSVPTYQMGRYAYDILKPYLPGPLLTGRAAVFNSDATNRVKNAMFEGSYSGTGGTFPNDWAANSVPDRSHSISAYDPIIGGKWLVMERTAGTDRLFISQYNDGAGGWQIGDKIAYAFWLRVPTLNTAGGAYYAVGTSGLAESRASVEAMTQPLPDPVFIYREFILTTNPTNTSFTANLYGVGRVEISRPKMINLTKQGADTL